MIPSQPDPTAWDIVMASVFENAWLIPAATSRECLDRKAFIGRLTSWAADQLEDGVPEAEIARRLPGAIRAQLADAEPGSFEEETYSAAGSRMLPAVLDFARGWISA